MPRSRIWSILALLLVIGLSAPMVAQDKAADKTKDKTPDKAAPKAAETPPSTPPAPAGDKVELKWKFEKGKPYYQEMTTKTVQDMKVMGMEVKQNQDQTFYFSWELKDEDKDKNLIVIQRIEGVKLTINIANNPITFDSSSTTGSNNALADFFRALVGTEFRLTIDKDGKVTKVEGRDDFLKKLSQANQAMEPLLKRVLSEEALKQMADPSFGMTPPNAVAKGESWTRDSKLQLGPIGSYNGTYKYTFEGLDEKNKDLAKIKVETTLTYVAPAEGAEGLPFRIKDAKLASKNGKGTIYFDLKKGRIDKSEHAIELDGKLNIEIAGMLTEVSLNQTQSTTVNSSDTPQVKKPGT